MTDPNCDLLPRLLGLEPDQGRPRAGEGLVVGFSGGADSVALLDVLGRVRDRLDLHLVAAHLDHALRQESAADVDFCRHFCAEREIPLVDRRIDVAAAARASGRGVEAEGRAQRYAFFEDAASAPFPAAATSRHPLACA